ncbi:MAG: MotA/TolQ/ExbB proton channel family protein [Hyphomicrobiaceae bacterium]
MTDMAQTAHSHRNLLFMRFVLFNVGATALAVAAYFQGWLDGLFLENIWIAALGIFVIFLYGLGLCGLKIWQTTMALNSVRSGSFGPGSRAQNYLETTDFSDPDNRVVQVNLLRLRLTHKISVVKQIANILVFLGLIGTVVGFIMALSGVDAKTAAETAHVAGIIRKLIEGMSVALYTTLLGAVLNLWLSINYRLLATGTVNLLGAMIEYGELHGRS